MKIIYQSRGFVTAAISAAILILGIVCMFTLTDVGTRFKVAGSKKEQANDTAQITLEELLNRPWSHPDLTALPDTHQRGAVSWEVTQVTARLKKIALTSTLQDPNNNSNHQLKVTGYKYDDF